MMYEIQVVCFEVNIYIYVYLILFLGLRQGYL